MYTPLDRFYLQLDPLIKNVVTQKVSSRNVGSKQNLYTYQEI